MNPELILKADLLDIVFENRNKAYGAYELRKHYSARLQKSLWMIFALTIFLFVTNFWLNHCLSRNHAYSLPSGGDTHLTDVVIKPSFSKPLMIERKKLATIQNTIPRIVNKLATVNPTLAVDDQEQNRIGTVTSAGDDGVIGNMQPQAISGLEKNDILSAPENEKKTILRFAEKMPEFPGGIKALQEFLIKNLRMPRDLEPGTNVRVLVQFVVEKDGQVNEVELIQIGGQDFDSEVIRVMKKMPRCTPGIQNGTTVAVYFNLPVVFRAEEENK